MSFLMGIKERFKQPVTEKASAAGDEDRRISELVEDTMGVCQNVLEVFDGEWLGRHIRL